MVVHSEDGLDEISIGAPTHVSELKDGMILNYDIMPEDFGLQRASLDSLKVNSAQQSLAVIRSVFAGEPGPARDIIQLNAGAAIYVAGITDTLEAGIERAGIVLTDGAAQARLDGLIQLSQSL